MVNSFFKNGDKAYSENLNDSILVGNAFDWTVEVSLPSDTGSVFPNSSTVVKAKVADLSITPNSNLSIGSTISNSSGSSQVYRLTVYPNFNRFGGFKSISLTADSGVTFYIANKGGTSPIASNLDYDDLGNVLELKLLKEYDIVITIPMNKEVTGLEFVFQSSSADVSGSISQSNVTGLGDRLTAIESKDTQQDGRLTALEEVDDGVFFYQVYASDYNPSIDSSVTVYCKCTDIAGSAVSGKSLTLYQNGTSVSSSITNENGIASWTVTCEEWGLQDFRVGNTSIQLNVTGWKQVQTLSSDRVRVFTDGKNAKIMIAGTFSTSTSSGQYNLATIDSQYQPAEDYSTNYSASVVTYYPVYLLANDTVVHIKKESTSSANMNVYCALFYPLKTPLY